MKTALKQYQRIEATGLWRPSPDVQRREVVVSLGEATLTISDFNEQALTHWSLAALERQNPGVFPAIFNPDGDPDETLELEDSETTMIEAIDRLQRAIDRARPHPGRLRWFSVAGVVAAVARCCCCGCRRLCKTTLSRSCPRSNAGYRQRDSAPDRAGFGAGLHV